MFKFFRRWSPIQRQQNSPEENKLATFIRKIQIRWADTLSRQDKKLTVNQRKIVTCLFMLVMSFLSGYWIYQGIIPGKASKPSFIQHEAITLPAKVSIPDSLDLNFLKAYQRWRMLKDSLPNTSKR